MKKTIQSFNSTLKRSPFKNKSGTITRGKHEVSYHLSKRKLSPKMKAQIANEAKLREIVKKRSGNLCEICHTKGDIRGLCLIHIKNKGMGGTSHVYTEDEVLWGCFPCHNKLFHHLSEVLP